MTAVGFHEAYMGLYTFLFQCVEVLRFRVVEAASVCRVSVPMCLANGSCISHACLLRLPRLYLPSTMPTQNTSSDVPPLPYNLVRGHRERSGELA